MSQQMEQSFTNRKRPVHNCNCCVFNCSSKKSKNRAIHFHRFPKKDASSVYITNAFGVVEKVDRRKAWINKLLMGKPVTKNMFVCSLHFQDSDYVSKGPALEYMKAPRLKATAVPSQNLPKTQHSKETISACMAQRKLRLERRSALRDEHIIPQSLSENIHLHNLESTENTEQKQVLELSDLTVDEQSVVHALLDLQNVRNEQFQDKAVQVKSGDLVWKFISTIESDKQLNSLTGIPNFEMLDNFVELISKHYPDKKTHKLTVKERIILVFMKLKMSVKFVVLSFLFRISQTPFLIAARVSSTLHINFEDNSKS